MLHLTGNIIILTTLNDPAVHQRNGQNIDQTNVAQSPIEINENVA